MLAKRNPLNVSMYPANPLHAEQLINEEYIIKQRGPCFLQSL